MSSRGKGSQKLRDQVVDDLVKGYYTEEQALVMYNITPSQLKAWLGKFGIKSRLPGHQSKDVKKQAVQSEEALKAANEKLQKALQEAELKNSYYQSVIRIAEAELGIDIEKSPLPSHPGNDRAESKVKPVSTLSDAWYYSTGFLQILLDSRKSK